MEPAFSEFLFSGKPLGRGLRSLPHPGRRLVTLKRQHPEQTTDFRDWSLWSISPCHTILLKGKGNARHGTYLKVFSPCDGVVGGSTLWARGYRRKPKNEFRSIQYSYRTEFPGKKMGWGDQLIIGFTTAQHYQPRTQHSKATTEDTQKMKL